MTATFDFFSDAGLTTPASVAINQASDGSTGPVEVQLYFGSAASGKKAQANSAPGTDLISVSPYDSASGSGQATSAIKLALTQGGLASAVAGAALSLGVTQVLSGTANAVSVWLRLEASSLVVGVYTDLELRANALYETAA